MAPPRILRAPAEQVYAAELALLADQDSQPRPEGWRLSPRAVRTFILGDAKAGIRRKYYGDDPLIDRCIVTLMSNRGLLLVGEPGTAKSMLSELLAAAIGGDSTCTIQGTSGTTGDQITYSWNYALLLAEGPTERALVKGPVYQAMESGRLCRFEEVTRVQPEIQDVLIGLLSDKVLHVPELDGGSATVFAERGFNVLATANLRDRGVHEMSSALKRRFNFETVKPISDRRKAIWMPASAVCSVTLSIASLTSAIAPTMRPLSSLEVHKVA
jgi:MoxR-like ATPase